MDRVCNLRIEESPGTHYAGHVTPPEPSRWEAFPVRWPKPERSPARCSSVAPGSTWWCVRPSPVAAAPPPEWCAYRTGAFRRNSHTRASWLRTFPAWWPCRSSRGSGSVSNGSGGGWRSRGAAGCSGIWTRRARSLAAAGSPHCESWRWTIWPRHPHAEEDTPYMCLSSSERNAMGFTMNRFMQIVVINNNNNNTVKLNSWWEKKDYLCALHTVPHTLHDQLVHLVAFRVKHDQRSREDGLDLKQWGGAQQGGVKHL